MKGEEITKSHMKRLEAVYEDPTHPHNNLVLIKRYLRKGVHRGLSWQSIQKDISTFVIFSKWCTIPIPELIDEDIYDFLDYLKDHTFERKGKKCHYSQVTISSYKAVLKKFFKINDKPDLIEPFKERIKNKKVIERDTLLDKQDIENLILYSENSRDRAIIATLHEAGSRKGELLSPSVKHAEFDSNGVKLTFPEGKTGPRTVRLVFASSYLREWIRDHPVKKDGKTDPDAPLFVSLQLYKGDDGKLVYNRLSDMGLYNQLQKIAKRARITKRVNPHSFRHARATELASLLTEQQMKNYLGWSPDSKMCAIYVHNPDTENAILNSYGIPIDNPVYEGLQVGRCPRCKELNPESYLFCGKCGLPLTQKAQDTVSGYEEKINLIYSVMGKILDGQVSQEEIKNVIKSRSKEHK